MALPEGIDTKQLRHTAAQIDDLLDAVPLDYAVTVPASGWTASAPYTATVSVPGMTADAVITDAVPDITGLSGTALADALAAAASWTTVEPGTNTLVFAARRQACGRHQAHCPRKRGRLMCTEARRRRLSLRSRPSWTSPRWPKPG